MARLQWNNVPIPDFTAAGKLQQDANLALQGSLDSVANFASSFADRQRAADEQALRIKAQSYMDNPEGFRKVLADGSFYGDVDPRTLSKDFINSMTTEPDSLLTSRNNFRTDARDEDKHARRQNANAVRNQITSLEMQGRHTEARQLAATNQDLLALDNDDYRQTNTNRMADGANTRKEQDSITTRQESQELASIESFLTSNSITDAGKMPLIHQMREGGQISDRVFNSLAQKYGTASPGGVGVGGGTGGGGWGAGSGMTDADWFSDSLTPYEAGLFGAESSNNPNARNPDSSATGLGQFLGSTFVNVMRKYHPDRVRGMSDDQIKELRTDPELNALAAVSLRKENATALQRAGVPLSPETMYLAHHFNAQRGVEIFRKAGTNTRMEDLLTPEELEANSSYKGKTYGEVSSGWAGRFSRHSPQDSMQQGMLAQDDASNAYNSVVGEDRRFLDLQADQRDMNQAITDSIGSKEAPGILSDVGVTRGMVAQAYRRAADMKPDNVDKEDLKGSNFSLSPAHIIDLLAQSRLPATGEPGYIQKAVGAVVGKSRPALAVDWDDFQRRLNQAYATSAQAGSQAGRGIEQAKAAQAQAQTQLQSAVAQVQQLEQMSRGNARLENSQQLQQARQDVILAQAQLDAATQAMKDVSIRVDTPDRVGFARTQREQEQAAAAERERQALINNSRPRRTPHSRIPEEERREAEMRKLRMFNNPRLL